MTQNTPKNAQDYAQPVGGSWLRSRLKRHISELVRLAVPSVMMRLGMGGLAIVDVAMVGHYATNHLAWLNLANQSYIMIANVLTLGLLMGVRVHTAVAFGKDKYHECGRIWRRTLPFTALISFFTVTIGLLSPFWLSWLGQSGEYVENSSRIIWILALGIPGNALFIHQFMFLEGIKRANIGSWAMWIGNIVNVFFNYILIFGHFGFPELGAEGSAWTSTIVRWVIGLTMTGYILFAPSMKAFDVHKKITEKWASWKEQRVMGYATALSLSSELVAFAALPIFAGWLGTLALASHGITAQLVTIPIMAALGIGSAASVRTSIASSRKDAPDTLLAVVTGLILISLVIIGLSIGIYSVSDTALGLFSNDPAVINFVSGLLLLIMTAMFFDAIQMVLSDLLRGLGEKWWPTILQSCAFLVVMLPASYIFTFPMSYGYQGLLMGMLAGVFASTLLQTGRLVVIIRQKWAQKDQN